MNPLQKFARLTPATQRRIIKGARQVARITRNVVEFDYVLDTMTEMEWNRLQSMREHRENNIRLRRA